MLNNIYWIIIINLALYYKHLRYKFVSDDMATFKNPPVVKDKWHKIFLRFIGAAKYQNDSYIPVMDKGKFKLIKIQTEEYEHLFAILLHTAICIMIYIVFGKNDISFIAALLYSTNPINNQATIWPGGRGYALPIFGLLLAMASVTIAPVGLLLCSWFTVGFLAPLALIGSKWWGLLLLMPIIWAVNAYKFKTAVGNKAGSESFTEDHRFHIGKIVLAIKTFGFYLTMCIFPYRITFYHAFLQSCAGNSIMRKRAYSLCKFFWIGLITGIAWIIYAIHSWNTLSWAMFAFMITILPFCNIRRANQEIAERFTALPNVFLMYLLAQLISPYPITVFVFITFYATRAYYSSMLYKDEYYITECAVIEDPHAWWAWHCRAMKRWDTGSYQEALILWVMAALISPKEFKILLNIATVLRLLKKDKEADEYLKRAEDNIVEGQEADAMRMITEHRQGRLPIVL